MPFPLCMESTLYVFAFRAVFLNLMAMGWIFYISLICKDAINIQFHKLDSATPNWEH